MNERKTSIKIKYYIQMNRTELIQTAEAMLADNKGILAMDESTPTCNKRFAALDLAQTEEMRRRYRELIINTPGLKEGVNAVILYDETVRQKLSHQKPFLQAVEDTGIIPGIKVDMGTRELVGFPGEKITLGLDSLQERLVEYKKMGLRFAKWRAVIAIDRGIPTSRSIENNAVALARYAALCQHIGLVPIVEPEVLINGNHELRKCFSVTQNVLHIVFDALHKQRVLLEAIVLKPNMITDGLDYFDPSTTKEVAQATVECLLRTVPAAVPGIAFLSGGQSPKKATEHLNAMQVDYNSKMPWKLTFSFSRALLAPALATWNGKEENVTKAQQVLYHRVMCNQAACLGTYSEVRENRL